MTSAQVSVARAASHRPSGPIRPGSSSTVAIWSTMDRAKETAADTVPSFSAVNREEVKIFAPVNRKARQCSRMAWTVSSHSCRS